MSHFFHWMTQNTDTLFWHDSGLPAEIAQGLERGATGITCNPAIGQKVMRADPVPWAGRVRELRQQYPGIDEEYLALKALNLVAQDCARQVRPVWDATGARQGQVAGQVNPLQMDDAEAMTWQAIEATSLEPNMAVKVPATAAGMKVIEEMGARGKITLSTVGFSTSQAVAAQEAYERGRRRAAAKANHVLNYSVMIIGRLDEYFLAKAQKEKLDISPEDINLAGLAVTKKINEVFAERGYRGMCLTGGTRTRHIPQLAGARMCMTIGVVPQNELLALNPEKCPLGDAPVPEDVIERLRAVFPEFSQALDVDGLDPAEFTSFGPCREMHDWFVTEFNGILDFVRSA